MYVTTCVDENKHTVYVSYQQTTHTQSSMISMHVQIPAGPTETEMECDASIRLGAVLSNAQQLEHNSNAELRAYLHMSAYLRLATQQRGVSCLSICLSVCPA